MQIACLLSTLCGLALLAVFMTRQEFVVLPGFSPLSETIRQSTSLK